MLHSPFLHQQAVVKLWLCLRRDVGKGDGERDAGRGSPLTGGCCCAGRSVASLEAGDGAREEQGSLQGCNSSRAFCKGSPRSHTAAGSWPWSQLMRQGQPGAAAGHAVHVVAGEPCSIHASAPRVTPTPLQDGQLPVQAAVLVPWQLLCNNRPSP